jgi:hypothetical protein
MVINLGAHGFQQFTRPYLFNAVYCITPQLSVRVFIGQIC